MKNIESYLHRTFKITLTKNPTNHMKNTKNYKEKAILSRNIDLYMKGAFLAAEAEIEMVKNKIDKIAAGFVLDFIKQENKPDTYKEIFNWS
jgi:hypothetical protein